MDNQNQMDPAERAVYQEVLTIMNASTIPFMVGGAHALERYTGIKRYTKDIDIFVRQEDCQKVLSLFSAKGYKTEMTHPHWLGKILFNQFVVDVIFSSGNGLARVDNEWFQHATEERVLGIPVRLAPAEEMIYSKAYIMERERFDGADVAHLILALGDRLDWRRLVDRMGSHWRVLLIHLILFDFAYPSERHKIPSWLIAEFVHRFEVERQESASEDPVCYGTFISREQYLNDIMQWGYADARLRSPQSMTEEEIRQWTSAIEGGDKHNNGRKVKPDGHVS
jgi:hypothetical protein